MFKIHDFWFRSIPRLVETIPPPKIQYTYTYTSYMEIRKPSILRHKRNLLNWRPRPSSELYYVPHEKTIHAEHHSKRGHGTAHIRRKHIHDESLRQTIVRQNSRECTFLERLHNIWISQRRSPSHIHNCVAHKTNCRYNHTRIHSALYLRMGHSSYSRNMEFRYPSSSSPQQPFKTKQKDEEEQQPEISDDRRTTAYTFFSARTSSLGLLAQ